MSSGPSLAPSAFFRYVQLPLARVFFGVLMLFFGPLKVVGKERVPRTGGVLILANHISDLDPIVTYMACPRPVYFMAKQELFAMRFVGAILRAFGTFPVKRGEPDREAIRRAVALLKAGQAVCIYPEGRLSPDGQLLPLEPGVALIARLAAVPVICVGLEGTTRVVPYGTTLPRPAFGGVFARWGELQATPPEDLLAWASDQLQELSGQR